MYSGSTPPHFPSWYAGGWNNFIDQSSYTLNGSGVLRTISGVIEVVPEPSSIGLLMVGVCTTLLRRKRL